MKKICLFAGTTEGRRLAEALHESFTLTVCVATEYGEVLLDGIDDIALHIGRMDSEQMTAFFGENNFELIIDATHPYAVLVTENIRAAAAETGIEYMRILRDCGEADGAVYVDSVAAARNFLNRVDGNILLTTGSKELNEFVGLDMSRVWARVLPLVSSLEACGEAGIMPSHIIAAQGPFSKELNIAELREIHAKWLVTKASGKNGGFDEKLSAAEAVGVKAIVIGAPKQVDGISLEAALDKLLPERTIMAENTGTAEDSDTNECHDTAKNLVTIVGIGPGGNQLLTVDAREAICHADAVVGAKSVVEAVDSIVGRGVPRFCEYLPERVREVIDANNIRNAVVVMRGDVGFYSGTKKLLAAFADMNVRVIPGISSVVYFAAKLGIAWDKAALLSLHGRGGSLIHTVRKNHQTIVLTGGENSVGAVCERLCEYGYGQVRCVVGERLSYADECLTEGRADELVGREFASLSLLYIENNDIDTTSRIGISDDEFIRGDVPMTKSEVRALSLSKLSLGEDSVVWDIGAGTGSVSIECALAACRGEVYAVERDSEACELIEKNARKFGCDNLHVVSGSAPDALNGLPVPTHAFIGGSSGNLHEIIKHILTVNSNVRIVINTVTLETLAEVVDCIHSFGFQNEDIVTVNVNRTRRAGRYHLMNAQNQVTIVTLWGGAANG